MKKKYFSILLCFLCVLSSLAIEGLRFENITNKNGLSHNTVRGIMQDKRGFIWVSTINGLNRYDGREFTVMLPKFGLPSLTESKIKNTIEDHNGGIWIHSTSGIVDCYNTHLEAFVNYTGTQDTKNYLGIQIATNGTIWLWGANGACQVQYVADKLTSHIFNKTTIGTDGINFVYEDSDHQIWLGTKTGLLQVVKNTAKQCFTGGASSDFRSAVELGKHIYFFTDNNRIVVFDKLRKTYLHDVEIDVPEGTLSINQTAALDESRILIAAKEATYVFDIDMSKVMSSKELFGAIHLKETRILTDNKNNKWVYNKSGNIWQYKPNINQFVRHELIPKTILSAIDLERYEIYCDSRNIIWITTYGNGLFALDQNTGQMSHLNTSNSGLKTNYLLSVLEDNLGEIWIGTEYTGISKISLTNYKNKVFFPDTDKTNVENKIIRTIYEDKKGDIWIGTKSGNIYVFDKNFKTKSTFSLSRGMPYVLTEDSIGNKWVGTKGNGLLVFSAKNDKLTETYSNISTDHRGLTNNNIYAILKDTKGRMWIGTFGGGLHLCQMNGSKLTFKRILSISDKQKLIRCIIQDSSGLIWVGGNNGLVVFDPEELLKNDTNFETFYFDKNNPHSLNNNEVKTIFEDSQNQIWVGTSGGGLNLAMKESGNKKFRFKHYSSDEGLINNVVQAILEDNERNLWISTENGISKLNTTSKVFENYNFSDIWESDLFCESSCFKRNNGDLLFGSYNGMYVFNSLSLQSSSHVCPVTITKLSINGIAATPNSNDSPLMRSITETKTIQLNNGQNSFSIEFSSLNFQDAYANRYTYILENYDKAWNPITQYNVATYKNIPAGNYIFRVRSCNSSGKWNDEDTILEINIVPPFWKSWQAIACYILLAIVIFFFAIKLILKMNKLHNDVVVEKQLTEYRLRFFTNISHEFRTPLTIIRGSIESMNTMAMLPSALKKQVKILDKGSSRLMRLIDQLLEFRKLQNDKMDLKVERTEAVSFFTEIHNMFAETAERKEIEFTCTSNEQSRTMLLDRGKLDKIVFNLLSNAFNHTPNRGKIVMELIFDNDANLFRLHISDSGIGIPKEKRDFLFVRFKQINYSLSGVGIGLHLTSELVNVHKGNIQYYDSALGGASFRVALPLADKAYTKDEIVNIETDIAREGIIENDILYQQAKPNSLKTYRILVVEDDEEIRAFLENQLEELFTISTAENGAIGLEKAIKEQPDLIICDVMMPEMDGFEATRKLKIDFQTSHIPIIMLTSHSSMEHQIEGIEAGADSYITKPFSTKYLMIRIIKLIEQREKLQHKFAQEPNMIQTTICTTDKDREFIAKMHLIIEENIDNPNFSVDVFAQSINLGRTIFYKKVKGLTGYSPNGYLRVIRMKKAAEMLKTSALNISEVAYKVGFNDPFYFSRLFKEQFGMTPTQFKDMPETGN